MTPHKDIEIDDQAGPPFTHKHNAYVSISLYRRRSSATSTRTMNDKTYPFIMNQRHYRIPQKVSSKKRVGGIRTMGMKRKLTRNV
jgi:hypothetical protein